MALSSLNTMSLDERGPREVAEARRYPLVAKTFLQTACGNAICEVLTIGPLETALATDEYTSKWMCGQRPE